MNRRRFLLGASLFMAAPAIIRTPGLLMPVKPLPVDVTPVGHIFVAAGNVRYSTCSDARIRQLPDVFDPRPSTFVYDGDNATIYDRQGNVIYEAHTPDGCERAFEIWGYRFPLYPQA